MAERSIETPSHRGVLTALLDVVERVGNKLPDQTTIFIGLALVTLAASAIASWAGLTIVHPVMDKPIQVFNLLSREGFQWVLSSVVKNFTGFAPLGVVLVTMIGVGVAERTGLFAAVLKALVLSVPRRAVTPTIIFAGLMSHTAADAGYVILPPLAAMLYASLGRHPIAGVAAAFAGIGGGFSANLLPCTLDPLLAGITEPAASFVDPAYRVNALANYYFTAASTILLVLVGWFISVRIVEPRMGPWRPETISVTPSDGGSMGPLAPAERRGLIIAGAVFLLLAGAIYGLVGFAGGVLRDEKASGVREFQPFFESLVPLIMILFLVPGLAYGLATRQIRSDRDSGAMMAQTMSTMGHYIVMAFFASQFIEWFKKSQLGLVVAIEGAAFLKGIHLTGLPLMIAFVVVTAILNLLISSASAKWTIMAPIFVPMLMLLGKSPETTQALYRVGDSVTNIVTPLNYYFPILLAVCHRYVPATGIGTLIAAMIPYSAAFFLAWTGMLLVWLALDVPLGPGAPLSYPPQ